MLVTVLLLTELSLRLLGFKPYHPPPIRIQFAPGSCFLTDSVWGISLKPGQYTVTLNDGLTYHVTHNAQGERICSAIPPPDSAAEWVFLGCSMTYGMGVDDSCAYPYRIQQAMPHVNVRNLAIPGTGGLHQYLRLKAYLEQGNKPDMVFFSYLDFHDSRNVFSSATAHLLRIGMNNNVRPEGSRFWGYAYAEQKAGQWTEHIRDLTRTPGRPGCIRYSAVCNLLQQQRDYRHDARLPMLESSKHYLLECARLCREKGIAFAVTFMNTGGNNQLIQQFCHENEIWIVDLSVDFSDPAMSNLPYDPHPSPLAHRRMAEKFLQQLHADTSARGNTP